MSERKWLPPEDWKCGVEGVGIDKNFIRTTVLGYEVSTCWRQSSAVLAPDYWYAETYIFGDVGRGREWLGDATDIGHKAAVERILQLGKWEEVSDE